MTSAQDEIPEPAEPAAHRETTAMDGRIPAALLDSLAQELSSYDTDTDPDTEDETQTSA